jgi:hypothetical protein
MQGLSQARRDLSARRMSQTRSRAGGVLIGEVEVRRGLSGAVETDRPHVARCGPRHAELAVALTFGLMVVLHWEWIRLAGTVISSALLFLGAVIYRATQRLGHSHIIDPC